MERSEDWQAHKEGILQSVSPAGHLESTLAERVALLSWRLYRVTHYETESIALGTESVEENLAQKRRFSARIADGIHPEDVRGNAKYTRSHHRLLKKLPKLKADKSIPGTDADSILCSVAARADEETDPEDLLGKLSIPGIPEGTEWGEYGGWSAGMVRAGIEAIAKATGEDPKDLLEVATEEARRDTRRAEHQAEQVELDLTNMRRERLLPDEKTLERLV